MEINMKKTAVFIVLLIVLGIIVYPILFKGTIKNYTSNYVIEQGYPTESIKNIEVQHSYSAKVLGYNEWRISVEFEKKPDIFFWFTYKDGKIIYEGVSSEPMMDKENVIKYSDMFKDGTLLN